MFVITASLLGSALVFPLSIAGATDIREELEEHFPAAGYFTMKDLEDEEIIMVTGRHIVPGDKYINVDNKLYYVEKVENRTAWARYMGEIKLAENPLALSQETGFTGVVAREGQADNNKGNVIAVYHSHGAEAYVPSDGSESIEEGGGILEVGSTFTDALKEKGFEVIFSDETHVPHDAGAYNRSRRTVEGLIGQGANILLDVHRDAVPAAEYTAVVNDEPTVQVQFVVGRQNQNQQAIREFAESLKATTDEIHPGLVKGIFFARGNYNQDMSPLALLLEVGSHENSREGAERSVELFADAVEVYFLGRETAAAREGVGMTALRSVLWVLLVSLLVLGIYMLVSTGSKEELSAKIKDFFGKEFAELRGRIGRKKEKRDSKNNKSFGSPVTSSVRRLEADTALKR